MEEDHSIPRIPKCRLPALVSDSASRERWRDSLYEEEPQLYIAHNVD